MPASVRKKATKGLERLTATVEAVDRPTDDLILMRVSRPGGADYAFKAGQFLYVYHPETDVKKPYSIASAPADDDRLDLCVKKVEGGALSTYLYDVQPGDELSISRAYGGFVLKTAPERAFVGMATGTGVAPVRSMIRQLVHDDDRREMWLLLGSSTRENLPYHNEFLALGEMLDHFHYVPTCSREGLDWTGERGWIQEPFMKHFLRRDKDYDVYLCGIKRMVDDVTQILTEEVGLDRRSVHAEKYV